MAARLEKQRTLQQSHGVAQTTGGRLWRRRRIRLYDGSSRAAVRAEAANGAEASRALSCLQKARAAGRRPRWRVMRGFFPILVFAMCLRAAGAERPSFQTLRYNEDWSF